MFDTMKDVEERDRNPESSDVATEIAQICGVLNAATACLVGLLARVVEIGSWQVSGIHNPTQWVAWQCGVSPTRAGSPAAVSEAHWLRRDETWVCV